MKNSDQDDAEWAKTRDLLREHLTPPPLRNPDFINSRVMEAIERDAKERASRPPLFSLRWLTYSGLGALGAAALLMFIVLPGQFAARHGSEFVSQVVEVQTGGPQLIASSFEAPGDRGVVLWIDGAEYIPPDEVVQ